MERSLLKDGSPEESIDYLRKWDLRVVQSVSGYRFAVDSLILPALATLPKGGRIADLGSGNGVVTFVAAKLSPGSQVVGVEVQEDMVKRAKKGALLNGLEGRVKFILGSYAKIDSLFPPESFDYVLSNPPYWPRGVGRRPPERERYLARHEVAATLDDLVRAASYLLPSKGRFGVIFCAERTPELLERLRANRLEPKRIRFVHPKQRSKAQFIFVESVKNAKPGQCDIESPLFIYDDSGVYTEEMEYLIGVRRGCGGS